MSNPTMGSQSTAPKHHHRTKVLSEPVVGGMFTAWDIQREVDRLAAGSTGIYLLDGGMDRAGSECVSVVLITWDHWASVTLARRYLYTISLYQFVELAIKPALQAIEAP